MLGVVIPFLAIAAGSFIGAAFAALHTRKFLARAQPASGVVVALARGGKGTYRAVVEHATPQGPSRFHDIVGSNPPAFQVGQPVSVLYDPSKPSRARIATTFRLWFLPGFFVLFGSIFGVVGAAVLGAGG